MTTITSVQSTTQKKSMKKAHISGEVTGLAAGAGMILTVASGYSKNKNFKKQHKKLALFSIIATALHIFLPKLMFKRKKN